MALDTFVVPDPDINNPTFCTTYTPLSAPTTSGPSTAPLVVNVLDYINSTSPTYASATEAIKAAAENIPTEGGVLYFPPGTYLLEPSCPPIVLKSRTWVRGAGRSTILRDATPGGQALLYIGGVEDVTISDIVFDVDHGECDDPPSVVSANFPHAIMIRSGPDILNSNAPAFAKNITVENCLFRTSGRPERGQTLHAVTCIDCDSIFLRNNRVIEMQFLVGAVKTCFIEGNYFENSHNLGISAFTKQTDTNVRELHITDNVFANLPSTGAIGIGTDGEGEAGDGLFRVIIRGNIIRGHFVGYDLGITSQCIFGVSEEHPTGPEEAAATGTTASYGIQINVPADIATDILIENNIFDNTAPTIETNTQAIIVQFGGSGSNALRSIIVSGNIARRLDLHFFRFGGTASRVIVKDNITENAPGVSIAAASGGIQDLIIANNQFACSNPGTHGCVVVHADSADITGLAIRNNIVSDVTGVAGSAWVGISVITDTGESITGDVVGNLVQADLGQMTTIKGLVGNSGAGLVRYLDNILPDAVEGYVDPLVIGSGLAYALRNRGVPDFSCGTGAIASGNVVEPIAHGLAGEVLGNPVVRITAIEQPPASWADAGCVWVSNIDDTGFVVNCALGPDSLESYEFAWRAEIPPG